MGALVALWGPSARAACVIGEPALTWSYPADGAVGVPTDAVLWTLGELGTHAAAARVGDVALAESSAPGGVASRFDFSAIGGLSPETEYVVTLDMARRFGSEGDPAGTAVIGFRTGAGPASGAPPDSPAAPVTVVVGHRQVDDEDYSGPEHPLPLCREVAWAQECYDTGPRATLSFHVTEPQEAPFFLVAPQDDNLGLPAAVLWPGECGPPAVFANTAWWWDDLEHCFDIRAAAPNGVLGPVTTYCGTFAPTGTGGVDHWEPGTSDGGDAGAADTGEAGAADASSADPTRGPDPGAGGCAAAPAAPAAPGSSGLVLVVAMALGLGAALLLRGPRARGPRARGPFDGALRPAVRPR